jgi:hypothetical protein
MIHTLEGMVVAFSYLFFFVAGMWCGYEIGKFVENNIKEKPKTKDIPCKSPLEIQRTLQSFETRHKNLVGRGDKTHSSAIAVKLIKLEAKIHILKNILKQQQ